MLSKNRVFRHSTVWDRLKMWELPQKFKEYKNIQYQTFVISVLN
ncbi:hypothetical protein LEP1GSC034_0575 [Leptospira interrogans str. 2003000735]|uniref:Uncharacterized protein n=3 Tax=Leptospira interrogans TaxID=173 RepID=M3I8J9_LEPIR|nr:hypothetical protein LEP1GSC025_2731 [Leptospira interrogans str. 2002000621]EKQ49136.1 hypothetical protein LEP1GSC026_3576 [Leptospira interrogans str. 2002000623]EMF70131.1 hypothetical protein LEP1GSC148_1057 [Leptospira interrogans serovar Canicola str. LT1962]EMG11721.1 hypothetical protein LEP1GSC151_2959 [Leptospira interrogans serovar Grippotyphosa str. LT2186]EMJ67270.1 hypothetical protein LEP1GSC034_0575 [Leptospira interrogans str. 2003000735]EMM91774.1 hypothetical protein LEP